MAAFVVVVVLCINRPLDSQTFYTTQYVEGRMTDNQRSIAREGGRIRAIVTLTCPSSL